MSIFNEIQKYLTNDDLESALNKLYIYAGHSENNEIQKWCNCELFGYSKEDNIPEYRKIDYNDLLIECRKGNNIKIISIPEAINMIDINQDEVKKRVLKFIDLECKEKKNLIYGFNKLIMYKSEYNISSSRLTNIITDFNIKEGSEYFTPDFAQFIPKKNINLYHRLKNDIKLKIVYYSNILKKEKIYLRTNKRIICSILGFITIFVAFLNDLQDTFLKWEWVKIIFSNVLRIFQF